MDEQAGRRRPKYLGFVAHELKNPLQNALWIAELLRREAEGRNAPREEKMATSALRSLRRMRRLVDDFFTIERLRDAVLDVRLERIFVRPLVDTALEHLREKDGLATEAVVVDVPEGLSVRCDAELIRRALRALIEDTLRFAQAEGVALSAQSTAETVALVVRPRGAKGPLVPPLPEDRPSGDASGAVLGYALAEEIARAHGGAVGEREGALVLTLPAA